MKKTLLLIVITFLASFSFSQKELAKKLIDTLASDAFYGRGYVNNGDKIAADYIAKKFKEFGALPVNGDSYFQEYSYPVNTFPTKVEVSFDNKTLTTGLDFIVAPNSGSAKGIFNLKEITLENYIEVVSKEEFQSDKNLTAFVIKLPKANGRDEYFKQLKLKNSVADVAPLFVINDEKFTWSVAQEALNYPVIEIKSEFLKDKKSVTLNIVNKLIADYQTQNVLGYIPAKRKCKRKKLQRII